MKVVAAAVVRNPLAGVFTEDLAELETLGADVAELLAPRAAAALGAERQSCVRGSVRDVSGMHKRVGCRFLSIP